MEKHPVLLPFDIVHAAYNASAEVWSESFVGPAGQAGVDEFWRRQWNHTWVQKHPAMQNPEEMPFTLGLGCHGDDVHHQNYRKLLVLAFNSVHSRAASMNSRWLFTVMLCDNMLDTETLEDLFAIWCWAFEHLLLGPFPATNFNGEPWEDNFHLQMAGLQRQRNETFVHLVNIISEL